MEMEDGQCGMQTEHGKWKVELVWYSLGLIDLAAPLRT